MTECISNIKNNIESVIVGKSDVIDLILTAIVAGGHILLEDMPGSGKTVMAKSLARSVKADFARVQMTPDLLPSDITGINIYDQKVGEFVFHKGPVFCNVLLADEINRATPRTQASLLECMEEKQVTIDGVTRKLEEPFLVIATQNPIETAGTFPLPEAQMDRFFMELSMGSVDAETELEIMRRYIQKNPFDEIDAVATKEDILSLQAQYHEVYIHPQLLEYIQKLCQATRDRKEVEAGVSVRGTLAFMRGCQAHALIQGRDYVIPEDIKLLAIPVLAHRLVLEGGYTGRKESIQVIENILSYVPLPTEDWSKRRG